MSSRRLTIGKKLWALLLLVGFGFTQSQASLVGEMEDDGTATNNSVATAVAVPADAFTFDLDPDIFTPADGGLAGTAKTASVVGHTGGGDDDAASLDIDFYSFDMVTSGFAWFDIDGDRTTSDPDSTLQLFDSKGTLIAQNDDSLFDLDGDTFVESDPGSRDDGFGSLDSFIGAISLTAGTYYVAVGEFSNSATGGGTGISTFLDSNFFPSGRTWWSTVSGATVGDDSFSGSGTQSASEDYILHISQIVPEPTSALMLLMALGVVSFAGLRQSQMDGPNRLQGNLMR